MYRGITPLFVLTITAMLWVAAPRTWAEKKGPVSWKRELRRAASYLRAPNKSYFMAWHKAQKILRSQQLVPHRIRRTASRIQALAHIGDLRQEMRRHHSLLGERYMTNNTVLSQDRWLEMTRDLYRQAHDSLQWELRRYKPSTRHLNPRTAGAMLRQRDRAQGMARFFKSRADFLQSQLVQRANAAPAARGAFLNSVSGFLSRNQAQVHKEHR
jgi:hypothetical protein